ncbi:hypothetical protein QBC35DRAFT_497855 [Podospora australis]|uniref:Extracellular membrane protein CFEM domain-containing protein n=1 Tax=Podospora australis TaxID=1536484 RepID=A0AAN7AHX1_9PEZI|nr:hypothetical protein QBC35DRAFT_497855 [Podospora australis]
MLSARFCALLGFLSVATAQIHPMITAPAALAARATDMSYTAGQDCQGSFVPWASCVAPKLTSMCEGINDPDPSETRIDLDCGCSQATTLHDCYTRFCSMGPDYGAYFTAVSLCAAEGHGKAPPAPTGAAAKFAGVKPNAAAPGVKTAGEMGLLWAIWGLVATGAFMGMLV